MTVRYKLMAGKAVGLEDGPDDAELEVLAEIADVTADGFDAATSFMRGKLKTTGSTGRFFELLKAGEIDAALRQLASRL